MHSLRPLLLITEVILWRLLELLTVAKKEKQSQFVGLCIVNVLVVFFSLGPQKSDFHQMASNMSHNSIEQVILFTILFARS